MTTTYDDGTVHDITDDGLIIIGSTAEGEIHVTHPGTVLKSDYGTFFNPTALIVGDTKKSALHIGDGGKTELKGAILGWSSGGEGVVNVDGSGSLMANQFELIVGDGGKGVLNITNGGKVSINNESRALIAGKFPGGEGSITIDGNNSVLDSQAGLFIGTKDAKGSVTVRNGGKLISKYSVYPGSAANANGTLIIENNGTVLAPDINGVPDSQKSALIFDGGRFQLARSLPDPAKLFEGFTAANPIELKAGGGIIDTQDFSATTHPDAVINGVGGLKKQGTGTLILANQNTYTGNTTIEQGTLRLADGTSLQSALSTVANGATLDIAKTATLQGLNNRGTLNLANDATNVLSVSGDFTQDANGTLKIKVADMTHYSKIAATGNVTVGGTLDVDAAAAAGLVDKGVLLDVVKAGGTRSGEFAQIADNSTLFNFEADYSRDAQAVDLKLVSAVTPPVNPPVNPPSGCNTVTGCVIAEHNWVAVPVARVLDDVIQNHTASDLAKVFVPLSGQKAVSDAAGETLPALAGAGNRVVMDAAQLVMASTREHATAATAESQNYAANPLLLADASGTVDGAALRRAYPDPTRRSIWGKVIGGWDKQKSAASVPGYDADHYGIVVGADAMANDSLRLGGALAYIRSDADSNGNAARQNLKADSFHALFYGDYALNDAANIDFQAGLGRANVDITRHIAFAQKTAQADYHSNIAQLGTGFSYRMGDAAHSITPFVRINYARVKDKAYRENGAGALNLNVADNTLESLVVRGGVRGKQQVGETLDLFADASIGAELMDKEARTTAEFAGFPGNAFTAKGADYGRAAGSLNFGAAWKPARNLEISGQYGVNLRRHFTEQSLGLRLKMKF